MAKRTGYEKEERGLTISKVLLAFVIFVLAVIFVYYGKDFLSKMLEYRDSKRGYQSIEEEVAKPAEEADPEALEAESIDNDAIYIDWEKFKGTEVIGWLQLDDIGYPILQTTDNDYYLHRLPDGTYNYGGSLFLQKENNKDFSDDNSFIYGHNMADGSMFGKLKKFTTEEYKDHTFDINRPDGTRHTYTFFSVVSVEKKDKAYSYHFVSKPDFLDYQEYVQSISLFQNSAKPDYKNRLVSLSTCNGYQGTSHRLLVQGVETRVVKTQKPASWYDKAWENYTNTPREESLKIFKSLMNRKAE